MLIAANGSCHWDSFWDLPLRQTAGIQLLTAHTAYNDTASIPHTRQERFDVPFYPISWGNTRAEWILSIWRLGSMVFGRPCIHLSLASRPSVSQELRHLCQGIMMWGVWVESRRGNPIRIPIYSLLPAISLVALEPLFCPPCLTSPLDTSSLTSFLAFEFAFKRPYLASCTPAHRSHAGRPRSKVECTSCLIPLRTNPFSQLAQRLWAPSVQCSGTEAGILSWGMDRALRISLAFTVNEALGFGKSFWPMPAFHNWDARLLHGYAYRLVTEQGEYHSNSLGIIPAYWASTVYCPALHADKLRVR